ncbi:MAG: hypothetical protein WBP16_07785 [Ferruginibacter sp.]
MENEIRKHIHNILAEATNRKKNIWKRIGEIIIEMLIIVFAVSLAVFMERQRELHHEQTEVKEFLTGLRTDLHNDIREMQDDKSIYQKLSKCFTYFALEKKLDRDTVNAYEWSLWNTVGLLVNNGRYEGFKASGKMNSIKDEELRNNILDLYQETLVALTNTTNGYVSSKKEFQRLIYRYRKNELEMNDNIIDILRQPQIKNYCFHLRYTNEPVRRYDKAIAASEKIIELINKNYPQ